MTKILDEHFPVVMGNCLHVKNEDETNPKESILICIQVEDETGKNEYPILLTQEEYTALPAVELPGMNDFIPGRIYPKYLHNKNYYCVKLKDVSGSVYIALFTIEQWKKCYERALCHPKSVTHKSVLTDLFD